MHSAIAWAIIIAGLWILAAAYCEEREHGQC